MKEPGESSGGAAARKQQVRSKMMWACFMAVLATEGVIACKLSVPVQSARAAQIETYELKHRLLPGDAGVQEAKVVLEAILGEANRCALEDAGQAAAWERVAEDLADENVVTNGTLTVTASAYPWDPSTFFVEGLGEYIIRDKNTDELLATGMFSIVDTGPWSLNDLSRDPKTGDLVLEVLLQQDLVRELVPGARRFVKRAQLVLQLLLKDMGEQRYSIDYRSEHQFGVVIPPDDPGPDLRVLPVGCLTFKSVPDDRNVLDLSSTDFAVPSYAGMLGDAGYYPQKNQRTIGWYGTAACAVFADGGLQLSDGPPSRIDGGDRLDPPEPCGPILDAGLDGGAEEAGKDEGYRDGGRKGQGVGQKTAKVVSIPAHKGDGG